MKPLLFTGLFLLAGLVSFAQPIVIDNATNCDFVVDLIQQDPNTCQEICTISNICVPAGSQIPVNPCCNSCIWLVALVTPADQNCNVCQRSYVKVYHVDNTCTNPISTGTYTHCLAGCGTYNLNWNNPTALKIY